MAKIQSSKALPHSNSVPSAPPVAPRPGKSAAMATLQAISRITIAAIYFALLGYVLLGLLAWNNPAITS